MNSRKSTAPERTSPMAAAIGVGLCALGLASLIAGMAALAAPAAPDQPAAQTVVAQSKVGEHDSPATGAGTAGNVSPAQVPKIAGVVTIAAAASLRDAITSAAEAYRKLHPSVEVRLVFGPSNQLARQIVEGAPVDLLFFADERSLDVVAKAGKIDPATRADLLTNALVAIAPASSTIRITSPEGLASPSVGKVAICDDAVPIGHYARTWLASKGLLARLEGRIVRPDDARATLAMVESEGVDLGFVYRTDARAARGARIVFEIPAAETPGIVYPAAVVKDGPNPAAARDLLVFLGSPAGLLHFEAAGFEHLSR